MLEKKINKKIYYNHLEISRSYRTLIKNYPNYSEQTKFRSIITREIIKVIKLHDSSSTIIIRFDNRALDGKSSARGFVKSPTLIARFRKLKTYDDVYYSHGQSKWFSVRRIGEIVMESTGRRGRGGNTRACQNQRDAGLHQSQVRPSYASARVEGRGEEPWFGTHWCRRLIERAVATRDLNRRNGAAAKVERSSFPGFIHRFFILCLYVEGNKAIKKDNEI